MRQSLLIVAALLVPGVLRAIAGAFASDDSDPINDWERVPGRAVGLRLP